MGFYPFLFLFVVATLVVIGALSLNGKAEVTGGGHDAHGHDDHGHH